LIDWLRARLSDLQKGAPGPDAINQGWRHEAANVLYALIRRLAGGRFDRLYTEHTDWLTAQVVKLAQRDPGTRALVVGNVQHCHIIRHRLRRYEPLQVVTYNEL